MVVSQRNEGLGRTPSQLATTEVFHDLVVFPIDFLAVLTAMGEQGGLLLFPDGGDVDVSRGRESDGLVADSSCDLPRMPASPRVR